jgi:phage-related tail protein
MEQNDVIIYSVKIDQTELIKQASELQTSIDNLVSEQKKLSESGEKNTATFQENASILRVLKREQADVNRQLDNSVKAFNASNGSISQQRANLSVLTKQYNDMSKEQRENTAVGGALQKQIKALSDELKKNESAIGDNRRNVGNYEGAITKVLGSFGGLGKALAGARTGMLGFNAATAANPIGALLALLIPIINAFLKFQPVVDATNVAMGVINATIEVLIARAGKLVDAFKALLSGDFSAAGDALAETFTGIGSAISEAAGAGAEYARTQKQISDQNQILAIQNAEAEKQITLSSPSLHECRA